MSKPTYNYIWTKAGYGEPIYFVTAHSKIEAYDKLAVALSTTATDVITQTKELHLRIHETIEPSATALEKAHD